MAVAVAFGGAGIAPASAVTTECKDGRCIFPLSKAETRDFGNGKIPKPPTADPRLRAAYYALAYGHKGIAKQYANRGWCSAFLISPRPWDNQGYTGYRC